MSTEFVPMTLVCPFTQAEDDEPEPTLKLPELRGGKI